MNERGFFTNWSEPHNGDAASAAAAFGRTRAIRARENFRVDARGRDSQLRCAGSVTQARSLRSVVVRNRKRKRNARVSERLCRLCAIGSLSMRSSAQALCDIAITATLPHPFPPECRKCRKGTAVGSVVARARPAIPSAW
ncbi:hypothetical protein [Lysobacter enzymogenes]|uniref:hypothetical protein n=1 Tax=Lysobacter enzymogenes TaxID=69 RepID=UPI000F4B790C|nr:hypothetical protein [Lysobacter enzymogenes]